MLTRSMDGTVKIWMREVKSFTKGRLNKGRWMDRQQHHDQKVVYFRKKNICDVWYNASEEELSSFKKMYVGVMKDAGSTHMVQEWFSMQGFFSVKVTPMWMEGGS